MSVPEHRPRAVSEFISPLWVARLACASRPGGTGPPAWVLPNRLRIADVPLDAARASVAAAIRHRTGVSVADAHLGCRRHQDHP
jgi:hypothetical protein